MSPIERHSIRWCQLEAGVDEESEAKAGNVDEETTMAEGANIATDKPTSATWRDFVELVRPMQWVKNVVVFAGPAAGLKLMEPTAFAHVFLAFGAFCLAASAAYAVNDVLDRAADASHPVKRSRPVARGAIQPSTAIVIGGCLIVIALMITQFALNRRVTAIVFLYFMLTLAYSAALKRWVILDVIIVATGFVFRAWAGSLAVGVAASEWLVACVFTLCLFMGFGKRRCELAMIDDLDEAYQHRRTLVRYTPDLLNHLTTVSAAIAVITFLLYTLDVGSSPPLFHKAHMFYSLPLVVYGVFRFAMLTELGVYSGPTEIVLKDRILLVTILLWACFTLAIAYEQPLLGPAGFEGLWGSP